MKKEQFEGDDSDYRPHVVERRDIQMSCFEVNNILRGGMARRSRNDPSEIGSQHLSIPRHGSMVDDLCAAMTTEHLSKSFLRLSVYVRTFDDIMRNREPTLAELYNKHKEAVQAQFVIGHEYDSTTIYTDEAEKFLAADFEAREVRNIRRCCGNIIHAEDFRPGYEEAKDGSGWSLDGSLHIEGLERGKGWFVALDAFQFLEAVLHLISFREARLS